MDFNLIIYLINIFYIIVNHSFNKIGIILNKRLDDHLHIHEQSNWNAVGTSSILAALGKFLGSFFNIVSIRYTLFILFILNGICIFLSLTTNSLGVFLLARNLQGLISGFQASIAIGLIALTKDNKVGFANFTGISAIVSTITGLLISLIDINSIGKILFFINIISSIFAFFALKDFRQPIGTIPIVTENIKTAITNKSFWFYGIMLGSILGINLTIIGQELQVLLEFFLIKKYSPLLVSMNFLFSAIFSFFYQLHQTRYAVFFAFISFLSFLLAIKLSSLLFFLFSTIGSFGSFALINPVILSRITLISSDKFVNSSFFFGIRSLVTSVVMIFLNKLCTNNILDRLFLLKLSFVSLLLCLIFVYIYEKLTFQINKN
jgi:MFS family permease